MLEIVDFVNVVDFVEDFDAGFFELRSILLDPPF